MPCRVAAKVDSWKPIAMRLWHWLNPMRAWRELRQGGASRNEIAAGIAVGVFIANLPAYGLQTVLALFAARQLRLHPIAVIAGSKVSTPPVGPLLISAAVWLGHLMLRGSRLTWKNLDLLHGNFFAHARPILLDWTVGSMVIGTVMAVGSFFLANFLFRFIEVRQSAYPEMGVVG